MTLPRIDYLAPTNLNEALSLLADDIAVEAGGTEIIGRLKQRLITPARVLSLRNVPSLRGIRTEGDEVVIGPMTTLREVARSPVVQKTCMAISQAASEVGAPPIQNIGTLGGNLLQNSRCLFYNQSELVRSAAKPCLKVGGQLCHAVKSSKKCFSVYQGDTAPALLCFGATVKLQKKDSSRTCALAELFTGSGESPFSITKDELLTEVRVPLPPAGSRSSFKKLRLRGSLDYPLASAAVLLSFGNGSISDASVAIGACGPAPVSVSAVTEALRGNSTGEADVSGAGELAAKLFRAADNLGVPGSYRRKMIKVMTARALREAIDQSGKEGS